MPPLRQDSAQSVPHLIDAHDLTESLGVTPDLGLSTAEAGARLASFGPNELRATEAVPLWRRVLAQFRDPLVVLLLIAIVVSLIAWLVEGADGVPVDAIVIALIVVLNAAIGFVEEEKANDAVAALADLTAATSSVLRDGQATAIPSSRLVPGDILLLSEGDAVGADARLLTATGLKVQEAALTGESAATVKSPQILSGELALADRVNMVYKGTGVVEGVGQAVVTSTGMGTEMGHIADLLDRTEQEPSPLQTEIARVSRSLGVIVVLIALVVMATLAIVQGADTSQEWVTILLLGVSLAVAAVPEGLPAILSLVLAIGVRDMARRHAVMKHLHSVETLGSTSVVCSDKTGTLTRNEMTLRTIVTLSGQVELTGIGYAPVGDATPQPRTGPSATPQTARETAAGGSADFDIEATLEEARVVLIGGSVANNATITEHDGEWEVHGDPTEAAFIVAKHKLDGAADRVERYERRAEVPFTSERKLMSVRAARDTAVEERIFTKGAPDVLLERCVGIRRGVGVVPLDDDSRRRVAAVVDQLSGEGYRTLGVAYRLVSDDDSRAAPGDPDGIEHHLILAGIVGIIDPPREEARTAVQAAKGAGVRTLMITGDHPATAQRIAADLGIITEGEPATSGLDLEPLTDAELDDLVAEVSVYARVAPAHKLRIVDALQRRGHIVAMTGDGVNDAPALKKADIGIAMGTGTEVTKEAARMILADDNFATIVASIRRGRIIFDNITKFLRYLLSSNMGEIFTVFFGIVLAGAIGLRDPSDPEALILPLLATQILWINLVTDSAPAIAMGLDPEIDDVMARPPRDPRRRIIDAAMWRRIISTGVVMGAVTLATMDLLLPGGFFEGDQAFETARTAGFTTLVFAQLFNALSARSAFQSAFHRMFHNPWLWGALGLTALLQVAVVNIPLLQNAFGTESLTGGQWLLTIAMASIVLWVTELIKLVQRLLRRGAQESRQVSSRQPPTSP